MNEKEYSRQQEKRAPDYHHMMDGNQVT